MVLWEIYLAWCLLISVHIVKSEICHFYFQKIANDVDGSNYFLYSLFELLRDSS